MSETPGASKPQICEVLSDWRQKHKPNAFRLKRHKEWSARTFVWWVLQLIGLETSLLRVLGIGFLKRRVLIIKTTTTMQQLKTWWLLYPRFLFKHTSLFILLQQWFECRTRCPCRSGRNHSRRLCCEKLQKNDSVVCQKMQSFYTICKIAKL